MSRHEQDKPLQARQRAAWCSSPHHRSASSTRNEYVLHVFILIMMNVVLGSSLRLINLSGQLSLGHGGFVTLGAYTSAVLLVKADFVHVARTAGLGAPRRGRICIILGFPFSRLKGIYFAMITHLLRAGDHSHGAAVAQRHRWPGRPAGRSPARFVSSAWSSTPRPRSTSCSWC